MVAPSKKAAPKLTNKPGQLRKPAGKLFRVMVRREDGVETVHGVRAGSEAAARAKVEAQLAESPGGWEVVTVAAQ